MEQNSEFARKAKEAIDAIDKLTRDAVRDIQEVIEKVSQLKDELKGGGEDGEPE